jgi:hypothetical protein
MRHPKRLIWIAVLPTTHLLLCALAALLPDVYWNWMWIILLDFPFTYALVKAEKLYNVVLISPLGLTILGTAWWLCIGIALSYIFERVTRKRNPKMP